MDQNPNSTYGKMAKPLKAGIGNVFIVCSASSTLNSRFQEVYPGDDGVASRVHATFTAALALCGTKTGDRIYVSADYTVVPTAAEMVSAETKGVEIRFLAREVAPTLIATRPSATISPTGANEPLFTVTGLVRVLSIYGKITTVLGATGTNLKLAATPTDSTNLAAADICANLAVASKKVNTYIKITGTVGDAAINSTAAATNPQALALDIQPGTIDCITSATNTGAIKWTCIYIPLEPGAYVIPA